MEDLANYLLLVRVEDGDAHEEIGIAREIADEYRERYPQEAATIFALHLEGAYRFAVQYLGPPEAPGWVEERIHAEFEAIDRSVEVMHLPARDIKAELGSRGEPGAGKTSL